MKKSHRIPFRAILLAIAAACMFAVFIMTGCDSCDSEHTHKYSTDWSYDETGHWHACTADDDCDSQSGYAEHTFDDGEKLDDGTYLYTCTVCGYQETSSAEVYQLTLTNMGGTALTGVSVELLSATTGKTAATGETGLSGNIRFKNLTSGTYYAYIDTDTLPIGYYLDDNQVELTSENRRVTQKVPSAVITSADMPSGTTYTTGSVVYDFTITCTNTDGTEYEVTLSDYISKYDAVFLNFFYTGCSPCRAEMPYMQEAYADYTGKVGLICFDYTGNGDTVALMRNFKSEYSLTFDFTYDSAGYYARYSVNAFPTTVVIDRYGCVALIDTGSNTSTTSWTSMFDYYTADEYNPTYASGKTDTSGSSSLVKADVEMPSSEAIAAVLNGSGTTDTTFTYSNYMEDGVVDEYNWPWIIGTSAKAGVDNYIYTSNQGRVGGYSIIVIDVSLTAGQAVLFDYFVSTEAEYDVFYVQVDTVLQATYSGDGSSWETCLAYVAKYTGDYQITLYYQKDSSKDYYDDTVYVSNLRIVDSTALATEEPDVCGDILYNAATNYTTETEVNGVAVSEYGEGYGYINYVSVYLASDGYYHVGSKADGSDPGDDPYLLADLYYGTPWYNDMSIWYEVYDYAGEDSLATFNNKLANAVKIGTAYEAFEDYTWAQNNCPWGYVPVNEELHDLLVAFVSAYGRDSDDYAYDNQWLELCRYYAHYGADHAAGDECYSVENIAETFGFRLAANLGTVDATTQNSNDTALTFTAEMETLLTPRGNYYKFTVSQSGVYRIYSYDYQTDADSAPYGFLVDVNGDVLDESEQDDLASIDGFKRSGWSDADTSYDFGIYYYLTAGETYYIATAFGSTEETGSYKVGIYYLGDTLSYFTTLTTGAYYTYAEGTDASGNTTYTYYLPTRVGQGRYAYNASEDCWYTLTASGAWDQPIYIDMVGDTWFNFYSSYTIKTAAAANSTLGTWTNAQLATVNHYLALAEANTDTITVNYGSGEEQVSLTGCWKATGDLVDCINILVNGGDSSTSSTYASNAWMLTAYYLRVVA